MTLPVEGLRSTAARAEDATTGFEAMFQTHWSRVCAIVCRIVGDGDEAEDIALEAFWRLYRKMRRVTTSRDDRNLAGWLYRVASNLGLNALRARKRRGQYEAQAGRRSLEAAQLTGSQRPAVAAARSEERGQVREVLSQMPSRSARVLILRHCGLSYAEVAAALGVAPSSVGTLLARAERDFEARYRAWEEGEE